MSVHTSHIRARNHHAHKATHTPSLCLSCWHHGGKAAVHHGHCVQVHHPSWPPLPTWHTPVPSGTSPTPLTQDLPSLQDTHLRFTPPLPVPQPNTPPQVGASAPTVLCPHPCPPLLQPDPSGRGNTARHPTVGLGAPFTPTSIHPSVGLASSTSEIFANHFLPLPSPNSLQLLPWGPARPPPSSPGPSLLRELPPKLHPTNSQAAQSAGRPHALLELVGTVPI